MSKYIRPIFLFSMFLTVSCANKFEVPSDINVRTNEQKVNVVHTVALSLEVANMFETTCTSKVDALVPPIPEPQRTEAIKLCAAEASAKFIADFMAIIAGANTASKP